MILGLRSDDDVCWNTSSTCSYIVRTMDSSKFDLVPPIIFNHWRLLVFRRIEKSTKM